MLVLSSFPLILFIYCFVCSVISSVGISKDYVRAQVLVGAELRHGKRATHIKMHVNILDQLKMEILCIDLNI